MFMSQAPKQQEKPLKRVQQSLPEALVNALNE
jgi:hypothetical protein